MGCQTIERANTTSILIHQGIKFLFSASIPEEITIKAEGSGKTREEAIQSALNEAVQKGIGVLVMSELTVENQKILNDRLIIYSSGFVKGYETEQCTEKSIISCKISAKVAPWKFKKSIEGTGGRALTINGETLLAQHDTLKHVVEQRKKITEYYFSRIRTEGFIGTIDSVEVVPGTGGKINLNIRYQIHWDKRFKEELIEFLTLLEEDTGGGFANYNEHTDIVIQWAPMGWLKSRVYIKPYDESYRKMMETYIHAPLAVTIQPFGECEYFNPDSIFYMGSGNGNTSISTQREKLEKIKKIEVEIGCR